MSTQLKSIINERVNILYSKASASIVTAIIASCIFAYLFRYQLPFVFVITWLALFLLVNLLRFWLVMDYQRNKDKVADHQQYEQRFYWVAGLVGIGWAVFIVQGLLLTEPEYQNYSMLLLVAVVAIAVPVFSSSIKTIYFFIAPPLLTALPVLLFEGGNAAYLALALLVYSVMIIRSGVDSYKTTSNTLLLHMQAQKMAENLKLMQDEHRVVEQRMQGIMDFAPAAIYIKDLQGHFTFVNQKVADLHNMSRQDMIGKTTFDVLPAEAAKECQRTDLKVMNSGEALEYEEQGDSSRHYFSIKFPIFADDNSVLGVGVVSSDITDRFAIEESFKLSQQRLLLHREQSPVGVIEWNTQFEFLDWNPAAERIFGFTKEEVTGHHITECILPESAREAVDEVWAQLLANTGGYYSLNENTTKDGRTIICEWHNTPLVDHDGIVIGVTSLVDDVTERENKEENLRRTQKMDAIGKLTGGIAHDFNNMLGVILGYGHLMKKRVNDDQPKLVKYSNEIINACDRAKRLTTKLLEFSRKVPSSDELTFINPLLQDMQHMLETTLTPRIKLVYELEENLWPVWLDKARLEDSILNMGINAMHAMADGGTLTLQTENTQLKETDAKSLRVSEGDYVLLTISDTGSGMSADVQQKMFDPFFTTKAESGTGLGMSQVYGFVQQINGDIKVYSEVGQGTRIEIYMPRSSKTEVVSTDNEMAKNEPLQTGHETILVVDDEITLLELAEEILTDNGYRVLRAENAEQALERLKNETVDLMLSDVIMPGKDGYQLAMEVQARYPAVKIQMTTGFSNERQNQLTDSQLHEERLLKPYTSEQLLSKLRLLLDK